MILDCTLRDGGYRNCWQFNADTVQDYLGVIDKSGIKLVEIGFRLLKKDENFGELAYCTDKFLRTLNMPDGIELAVMVKAEELLGSDVKNVLDSMFADKKDSPVDLVRIAVPYQQAPECHEICKILKRKGYRVSLNLTKLVPGCEKELIKTLQTMKSWENFDLLYFADTFGQLCPDDVKRITELIKTEYTGLTGFHGHNDRGLALANSLAAIGSGVDYVDSTLSGIGKGSGNLATEEITRELNERYNCKYDINTAASSLFKIAA